MQPDDVEIRVLGCLIEKQRTTPDAYPLTLNALRLACNQATNRDPVVDYDEPAVRDAAQRLGQRRWARLASGAGSRAPKYRQLLDAALGIGPAEMAVLCVLMLRGPQTPGELKQRTERMHAFADPAAVEVTLARLIDAGHAERLPRRPGQKEERYVQRLGGGGGPDPAAAGTGAAVGPAAAGRTGGESAAPAAETATGPDAPHPAPSDDGRLERLEREVARLSAELAELRGELGG